MSAVTVRRSGLFTKKLLMLATAMTSVAALPAHADVTLTGTVTNQVNLDALQSGGGIATVTSGTVVNGLGSAPGAVVGTTTILGATAIYSPNGVNLSGSTPLWNLTNAGIVAPDLSNLSSTTISGGVYLGAGSIVTNQAGGIIAGGRNGISVSSFTGATTSTVQSVVTNNGTVISFIAAPFLTNPLNPGPIAPGGGAGIAMNRGGSVTNNGLIVTGASTSAAGNLSSITMGAGNGNAISINGGSGFVVNSGTTFGNITLSGGGNVNNMSSGRVNAGIPNSGNFAAISVLTSTQITTVSGLTTVFVGGGSVTNSGMVTSTGAIGVRTSRLTNSAGGVISSTGTFDDMVYDERRIGDGVMIIGGVEANTVDNAGTISGATHGLYYGRVITFNSLGQPVNFSPYGAGTFLNQATGRITGGVVGVDAGEQSLTSLTNRGIIEGTNGIGIIFDGEDEDSVITNSGQILGGGNLFASPLTPTNIAAIEDTDFYGVAPLGAGIAITEYGEDSTDSVQFNNESGGIVRGGNAGVITLAGEFDGTPTDTLSGASALVINNSGEISATVSGAGLMAVGSATVTNSASGTINGKTVQTGSGMETLGLWIVGNGVVSNAGTINGHVKIDRTGSLTNSGTINLAAGPQFGTSTITGSFTNTSTGKLIFKVNEANQSDTMMVTGAVNLQGGTVSVVAPDGTWDVAHNYTIITATGGVTGTFSGADINQEYLTPILSYSANSVTLNVARRSAEIQEDVISETTEQQVSTSARRVAAAIDARVDQAIAAAFIALPGLDNTAFAPGTVSGLAAGDSGGGKWGSWATFSPTFLRQNLVLPGATAAQKVTGTSLSFLAGLDRAVGSRAVVGAFASYESSDYDISANAGERKGKGPLAGAYAGLLISNWAYASIQVNHAWLTNRLSESTFAAGAPVTGKFDSKRFMASTTLTARRSFEILTASAKVGYSYTRENFDGYIASDGTPVSPPATRLGRISVGGELMGNGKTFVPYASATYESDVDTTGVGDRKGVVLGGGLRYITGMFSFDVYGSSQFARSSERAYSLGVNARYAF